MRVGVDADRAFVEMEPESGVAEVLGAAVRQRVPVGNFTGHVVRDGVVGIVVGDDELDVGGGVEFAGAGLR
ncbi:hypothetical protein GCM10010530_18480 [Kribbella aluminosa]